MLSATMLASLPTVGLILAAMAVVALLETLLPLHARGRWGRAHLAPNLALTFLTFASNIVLNALLIVALVWAQSARVGLFNLLAAPAAVGVIAAVLWLDFSFYVAHRAMHISPMLWRFHSVHHADPFVDVTTTIRQHPGESLIRYGFLAVFAITLGVSPAGFAVYRMASVLIGLMEHSNTRLPAWLDRALVLLISTPNMHKVHHSRDAAQSETNFSNVTSIWDRLFGTFTSSARGTDIAYGLEGHDDPAGQSTLGLLAMPFRRSAADGRAAAAGETS
jgi:sterol desaturase/sphingolipid hydroxylase (fatty acid hydroxylase superfamily)